MHEQNLQMQMKPWLFPEVQATALLFANFNECMLLPNAIVELSDNCKVDALVNIVLEIMFVVLNLPPFKIVCELRVAGVEAGFNLSSPSVTVVVPV